MSPAASLQALRQRIQQLEQPHRHGALPFGVVAIDRALPAGGLALGAVHEIIGTGGDEEDGAAAAGFAAGILARLGPMDGKAPVLWCLKRADLYGPGLLAHGLDPDRLVLVRARRDDAILWAVEEGVRAGLASGLAAVIGEVGQLPMVAGRRLQLAAERSGVTVLLLRRWRNAAEAKAARARPSAALTRWRIGTLPSSPPALPTALNNPSPPARGGRGQGEGGLRHELRVSPPHPSLSPHWGEEAKNFGVARGSGFGIGQPRWRVELLRVRGGTPCIWDVEVADATGHVSLSAELADRPAAPLRLHNEPQRRAG